MSSRRIRRTALPALAAFALFVQGAAVCASSLLFIGNSFTFAEGSPVHFYHPETVSDLNGGGVGGVPALFKSFTMQAGLKFEVSLETAPGMGLDYHYKNKVEIIGKPWDYVVMHGYSTLDQAKPGDPTLLIKSTKQVAELLHEKNPKVDIRLMATWTRADLTYLPTGHWYGKPVDAMEKDIRAGYDLAAAGCPYIKGVIPVGETWNRAIASGFADANPFDGIDGGKVDLWTYDNYHGSTFGYYLEGLTVFGAITGLDPRSLGGHERSAYELGLSPTQAATMQQIAFDQLTADGHKDLKPFTPVSITGH
jgi:hypothetical protein